MVLIQKKALVLKLFNGIDLPVVGPQIYTKLRLKSKEIAEHKVKHIHNNETSFSFTKSVNRYMLLNEQ